VQNKFVTRLQRQTRNRYALRNETTKFNELRLNQ